MEKQRKSDLNRTSRNEARCSYSTRGDTESARGTGRLCRPLRFLNRLGVKKTKQHNAVSNNVQDDSAGHEASDEKDEGAAGFNKDFPDEGNSLRNVEEEEKKGNIDFLVPVVENTWESVGIYPAELIPPFAEGGSTPKIKISNDSVTSTSAVIVVDDSKCDTRLKPNEFQTALEIKDSRLSTSHHNNVSVESQHISSRSSANVSELKTSSGSTAIRDIAEEVLDAHIAREKRISAAISSHVAKVTEWKREVSLFESTESVLGLLQGPSVLPRCNGESSVQSSHGLARYSSNTGIRLSDTRLLEDDEGGQDLLLEADELLEEEEEDDEDACTEVTLEMNDPLSQTRLSSTASLLTFKGEPSRPKRWKANLVNAATSAKSMTIVQKEDVSTNITPVASHLRTADVTHIDGSGIAAEKPKRVHVKWGGGWKTSNTEQDSSCKLTPKANSSISFVSPSARCSSPGFSLGTLDSLSTLTVSEELDCPLPPTACSHADTQAVLKLAQLLDELSANEQPWVRFFKNILLVAKCKLRKRRELTVEHLNPPHRK